MALAPRALLQRLHPRASRIIVASSILGLVLRLLHAALLAHAEADVHRWVEARETNDRFAASGLRDLDPHVFIISLVPDSNSRLEAAMHDLLGFGVRPERIHVVPAVDGSTCRMQRGAAPGGASNHGLYDRISAWFDVDGCPLACACFATETVCPEEPASVFECSVNDGPPILVNVTPTFLARDNAVAEFATAASHLRALRAIHDSGVEWGLVLEDDASLALVPEWGTFGLRESLAALPSSWGVLQCYVWFGGPWALEHMRADLLSGRLVSKRGGYGIDREMWGAVAYVASHRGARDLLDIYWPGRKTMDLRRNPLSDVLLYTGDETYVVNRPLFAHQLQISTPGGGAANSGQAGSTIHSSHIVTHGHARQRLLRVFYSEKTGSDRRPHVSRPRLFYQLLGLVHWVHAALSDFSVFHTPFVFVRVVNLTFFLTIPALCILFGQSTTRERCCGGHSLRRAACGIDDLSKTL